METIAIIPIVTGLVEVAKRTGLSGKFAPVAALVLGIVLTATWEGVSPESLVTGIVYGLSASGFYDGAKTTVSAIQKKMAPETPPTP